METAGACGARSKTQLLIRSLGLDRQWTGFHHTFGGSQAHGDRLETCPTNRHGNPLSCFAPAPVLSGDLRLRMRRFPELRVDFRSHRIVAFVTQADRRRCRVGDLRRSAHPRVFCPIEPVPAHPVAQRTPWGSPVGCGRPLRPACPRAEICEGRAECRPREGFDPRNCALPVCTKRLSPRAGLGSSSTHLRRSRAVLPDDNNGTQYLNSCASTVMRSPG